MVKHKQKNYYYKQKNCTVSTSGEWKKDIANSI